MNSKKKRAIKAHQEKFEVFYKANYRTIDVPLSWIGGLCLAWGIVGFVLWYLYPTWGWKVILIAFAGALAALIAKVYVRYQAVRLWQKWEQKD